MLSQRVRDRLLLARSLETSYQPNATISKALAEKTLVMLVGPAAVGKSFLIRHIIEIDSSFNRVPVFTTRDPRPDDEPGIFRNYPHNDESLSSLFDKIEKKEIVQYAIHPTSERLYGTAINDFSGEFNLLATLSSVVTHLQQLPFKQTYVIGLAARPDIWKQRFNVRYPQKNDEQAKRLQEAIASLEWLLAGRQRSVVKWVDNSSEQPDNAIQSVIDIVKYNQQGDAQARHYARQMLESARRAIKRSL